MSPGARPTYLSRPGPRQLLSSSSPRCQASRWQSADAVDATATSTPFQASPCPLLMSRTTHIKPCFTSPSYHVLSPPLLLFPFVFESNRGLPSQELVATVP